MGQREVAQVVEHLLYMYKTLDLIPTYTSFNSGDHQAKSKLKD